MFASRTLSEHLARGLFGIGAVALVMYVPTPMLPEWLDAIGRIVLAIGALALLRGCPMCWLYGLVVTIVARVSGRSAGPTCPDGACARR